MSDIETTYILDKTQIDFYNKNGYIKLKNILSAAEINYYNQVITEVIHKMKKEEIPLEQRDTYGKAFLQLFNLWKEDARVKELIFNKRLGQIASELMQVNGVRLYHDQALFKEPQGGITPWHADQHYWPLASDKAITAWIPLQEVPLEMGPLEFSAGSQHLITGRELSISDESETVISEKIRLSNFEHIIEPFNIGEVSFHSGWVFHRAGANTTNNMRKVMTIIYMDKDMKLKKPKNSGQLNDWNTWCPGAKLDEVIQTHLNPILYEI
jgi:ectoine hydroxylase-related dioxygenase (phytanoyl-CoA dioxygenase family)